MSKQPKPPTAEASQLPSQTQPQPYAPHDQPGTPQYSHVQTAPGQTTGIIGLVFAFIGFAPIGLILSIVSTVQASRAKTSKALGVVGIIFNALGTIIMGIAITFTIIGVQERARESAAAKLAYEVSRRAEIYYAKEGSYPQTIQDFNKRPESSLPSSNVNVTAMAPHDTSTVLYRACGKTGAQIAYYSVKLERPLYRYIGDGDTQSCIK